MKKIFFLILIPILVSCSNDKPLDLSSKNKDTTALTIVQPTTPQEIDKTKITHNSHWVANHSDTSNYLVELAFHDEYVIYLYHGQCAYYYFTYKIQDDIELLWSYKSDCLLNMDMLEKSHALKSYPKKGDVFAIYRLINDSTLKVTYNFPEWIKKINQIAKDSIFPLYFTKLR